MEKQKDTKNFKEKIDTLVNDVDQTSNPQLAQQLQQEANSLTEQFSYLNQHFVTAYNHLVRVQKMVDKYPDEKVSSS